MITGSRDLLKIRPSRESCDSIPKYVEYRSSKDRKAGKWDGEKFAGERRSRFSYNTERR